MGFLIEAIAEIENMCVRKKNDFLRCSMLQYVGRAPFKKKLSPDNLLSNSLQINGTFPRIC
jgi:hypothetical protein